MKAELEIDVYADVEPEGIIRALYLGTACESQLEGVETWEEIVERNIDIILFQVVTLSDLVMLNS